MGLFEKLKKGKVAGGGGATAGAAVFQDEPLPPPLTTELTMVMPWSIDGDDGYRFAETLHAIVAAQPDAKVYPGAVWGRADVMVRVVERGTAAVLVVLDQPWHGQTAAVIGEEQYPYLRPLVRDAIAKHGVANTPARIQVLDTFYTVTLAWEMAGPMSAYIIQSQVDAICDEWVARDELEVVDDSFMDSVGSVRLQRRPYGWRLFDASWFDDDTEEAKWLAKQLRKLGYKATVGSEGGHPGVKITAHESKPVLQ
jgi:hypothetical protein